MATPIQELVDQRVALVEKSRAFLDECEKAGGLTEEQDAQFEKMRADVGDLKAQIDDAVKAEETAAARRLQVDEMEAELQAANGSTAIERIRNARRPHQEGDDPRKMDRFTAVNQAVQIWGRQGRAGIAGNEAFVEAFKASGCSWDNDDGGLCVSLLAEAPRNIYDIRAAQSIGTDTAGGHTTFPGFIPNLERALLEFGGVRQVAEIIRTATGSELDWPTSDDTSNTGEQIGENVEDTEQDVTFGNFRLNAYKFSSKIVKVSKELMQDSAFNLAAVLGSMLGERLGRITNTRATTGSGTNTLNGIVTASTLGKTAVATAAITMDELKDLKRSVGRAYRNGAGWMWNDATEGYVAKLKSADNIYHWQPGVIAGEPDRFLNGSVTVNDDMADIGAAAKTVLYGQLSKYKLREVLGVTLVRLDERYAEKHQVGFVAILRVDGDLLDAGTAPVKHLIQAAA